MELINGQTRDLPIPTPRGMAVRVGLMYAIGFGLVSAFCLLAAKNLTSFRETGWGALAASALWLLLVGFVAITVLVVTVREIGWKQCAINRLGDFSGKHWVRVLKGEDGQMRVTFVYRIFTCDFDLLILEARGIRKVDWSTGQATHFAGRDMNDWSVVIRFDSKAIRKTRLGFINDLYIVATQGPRTRVEAFGRELVEFLHLAGLEFLEDKSGRGFVVASA